MIVDTALQEDVDVIALSILSGVHMTLFGKAIDLMKMQGLDGVLLTGGGMIPEEDMKKLEEIGVGKLIDPGTNTQDIIEYITRCHQGNR
jgi:methylmalonyl-CoA mutase C-terminal domain/subunit